jgi:hypothetical protein
MATVMARAKVSNIAQSHFCDPVYLLSALPLRDDKEPLRSIVTIAAVPFPLCYQCGEMRTVQ